MEKAFLNIIAIVVLLKVQVQMVQAQDCNSINDVTYVEGKFIDAAHFEWPQQRAHWFDELHSTAYKATANTILTKIETLEKKSRSNYKLLGAVLKTAYAAKAVAPMGGKYNLASYDLNIGCYEYFCYKNKMKVSDEYSNVFRAYINRYSNLERAFTFSDDNYYYETPELNNGKYVALLNFIKLDASKYPNNEKGFYQDIAESTVKEGNRNVFMTRHWYFTKSSQLLFIPVTRKEYLEALLVYYDREKHFITDKIKEIETECAGMMKNPQKYPQLYENGKRNLISRKAKYPDWEQKIESKKSIVQKALKENNANWLAQPAIVKPKNESFAWKYTYGSAPNDNTWIDVYYADNKADAEKLGTLAFSGFWDDKNGATLYKYNPDYFKGAETNPAKPFFIELTYRYVKTSLGKSLVENFTSNFDFDAVKKMVE